MDIGLMAHRGPDAQALVHDGDEISFAHARLSILELTERARQPQWSGSGRVLLTYNGEIYNFAELSVGESHSDTVALAQWLSDRGPAFDAGELDGMYAFGAWFAEERQLVLCRDPAGIKPLYIAFDASGQRMAFASEIKGFFDVDWFSAQPSLDAQTHRDVLQFGFVTPRNVGLIYRGHEARLELVPTLLHSVYQLCPGQKLIVGPEGTLRCEWIKLRPQDGDAMETLAASVRSQAMSDVQVGVQISGGIDSSLVAWEYARQFSRSDQPLKGFYVSVPGRDLNEDQWVDIATAKIGEVAPFELERIELTPAALARVLPAVVWHMDEPAVRHPNAVGVYLLCEHVRRNSAVKVLLTGEGADEIFGGYGWHDGITTEDFEKTRRMFDLGGSDGVRSKFASTQGGVLGRQTAFDRWFYLPPILARQDRMSMAHGIEARVPFLANAFLGRGAPAAAGKLELKRAAANIFGEKFAYRDKCGFGMPWPWLGTIEQPDWGALDWLAIKPEAKTPLQRWTIAALAMWSRQFLDGGWKIHRQKCAA
jgi:asparagine synthase (glutamine-hydrolysing)